MGARDDNCSYVPVKQIARGAGGVFVGGGDLNISKLNGVNFGAIPNALNPSSRMSTDTQADHLPSLFFALSLPLPESLALSLPPFLGAALF